MASLYSHQGRYAEAAPLYNQSLAITEKTLGPDHPNFASSLNDLAVLYYKQGCYADAEPLLKRSLVIRKKALGSDHPDVALSLNNLASLYQKQGRYADAERFAHTCARTVYGDSSAARESRRPWIETTAAYGTPRRSAVVGFR